MIHLKRLAISIMLLLTTSFVLPVAASALATTQPPSNILAASSLKGEACNGLKQIDSDQGCGKGSNAFYGVIKTVVNLISYIAGIIAVIMVMVAGVKYMTSGGDSNGVASAKTTLIYAIIGIAVVALAQFLVQVVLSEATKSL